MIEVATCYEVLPEIDLKEYQSWSKKVIDTILKAPGIVEFKAHRNMGSSPQVRSTTVWKSLADWANFSESVEWQEIDTEMRLKYAANVELQIWKPSPIVPKSKRPKRK